MDRSHLNFRSLLIGHESEEIINLMNNEERSFDFQFLQSSCLAPGCDIVEEEERGRSKEKSNVKKDKFDVCLRVEPMTGTLLPHERFVRKINYSFIFYTKKYICCYL